MLFLVNVCERTVVLKVFYFVIQLLNIARFTIPIALILMTSFDFFKNVMANEGEMANNTKLVFRRVLYGVMIFLVPTIVNLTVTLLNKANIDLVYNTCINNAKVDIIKKFEAKEAANKEEIDSTPSTTPKDKSQSKKRKLKNAEQKTTDNNNESDSDSDIDYSGITSQGAQRILDFAERKYQKIESSKKQWKHCSQNCSGCKLNKDCTTCCHFVSDVLKATGYLKRGQILCHKHSPTKPMGSKYLINMKVMPNRKASQLKPGDVIIYGTSNIAIFAYKKNGKLYVYGASEKKEIRHKNHPYPYGYWQKSSRKNHLTIIRATK